MKNVVYEPQQVKPHPDEKSSNTFDRIMTSSIYFEFQKRDETETKTEKGGIEWLLSIYWILVKYDSRINIL